MGDFIALHDDATKATFTLPNKKATILSVEDLALNLKLVHHFKLISLYTEKCNVLLKAALRNNPNIFNDKARLAELTKDAVNFMCVYLKELSPSKKEFSLKPSTLLLIYRN